MANRRSNGKIGDCEQSNYSSVTIFSPFSECEGATILDDFLRYFKHIYQIENNEYVNDSIENTQTIPKKWEPFLPYL